MNLQWFNTGSPHGTAHACHAVRRRHAHRKPGRHHAACPAGPPRGRAHRGGGHPPHGQSPAPVRYPHADDELPRAQRTAEDPLLLDRLAARERLALVSDAGTPGIADPGYRLVRAALDAGLPVQAVPGPSAVLGALVSSGFPTDSFTFLGFPPRKPAARDAWLAGLSVEPRTVVFFEAPHRLRQTLGVMARILGDRPICLTKELTKVFESTFVGTSSAALNMLNDPKGEYAVVVSPPTSDKASSGQATHQTGRLANLLVV